MVAIEKNQNKIPESDTDWNDCHRHPTHKKLYNLSGVQNVLVHVKQSNEYKITV